jgi:uncharacterized membrane protein (UPF0182 family)
VLTHVNYMGGRGIMCFFVLILTKNVIKILFVTMHILNNVVMHSNAYWCLNVNSMVDNHKKKLLSVIEIIIGIILVLTKGVIFSYSILIF